jgi:3-hydroxyisobutyrate dehydrogenase-like beta-hydroxyacid dehydrogenase
MKIGFIGLGQMGREMAARLIGAGHELVVYNRSPGPAQAFQGRAGIASRPAQAADAEVVITMLADDAAVDAVWSAIELPAGAVHLNMATVSMGLARRFAQRQKSYVAAPVFGRPPAAAKGELDIVAAGPAEALERCSPLFSILGKQLFIVGAQPAQANAVKIARNFLLSTVIEGLGEAISLARACGVSAEEFVKVITSTSLAAPAYRNYGKLMVERRYEPAQFNMHLGLKDVELALATAADAGVALPTAELIRGNLLNAIAQGQGGKDWAALAEVVRKSG